MDRDHSPSGYYRVVIQVEKEGFFSDLYTSREKATAAAVRLRMNRSDITRITVISNEFFLRHNIDPAELFPPIDQ